MVISKNKTVQANTYVADEEPTAGITVVLTAYADNDVVGGLLEFDVHTTMGGGLINRVRLVDEDKQDEPYRLFLFNALPSIIADDAAFVPTVADLQKLVAVVSISGATEDTFDWWHSATLNYSFTVDGGKLYGYLVANASTPDYANVDTLTLYLEIVSEG